MKKTMILKNSILLKPCGILPQAFLLCNINNKKNKTKAKIKQNKRNLVRNFTRFGKMHIKREIKTKKGEI